MLAEGFLDFTRLSSGAKFSGNTGVDFAHASPRRKESLGGVEEDCVVFQWAVEEEAVDSMASSSSLPT
jgi:hypothetical protein